jgi:hypothetical protein
MLYIVLTIVKMMDILLHNTLIFLAGRGEVRKLSSFWLDMHMLNMKSN